MKPIRQWNSSALIIVVAIVAFIWYAVAYIIADTGYPGGISARDENLIYAGLAFILGFAGWVGVWRKDVFVPNLDRRIEGRWAVIWGYVAVVLCWGVALWFAVQAFR